MMSSIADHERHRKERRVPAEKIQLPGCAAIDADGTKCELVSVGVFVYHGNPHLYAKSLFPTPMRVLVWLCKNHSGGLTRWEPDDV